MLERHRKMWLKWLADHCEGCGTKQERGRVLQSKCPNPNCSLRVTAVNPENLLPVLETAWMNGHGPSGRRAGNEWDAMRLVAGEYLSCNEDKTGLVGLDARLDELVKLLVDSGG